jgi:adenosylmethionine-8-amino-7-oxononanoate aminotransferase
MTAALQMSKTNLSSAVFPRGAFRPSVSKAVAGDGAWLIDSDGRRFLDACGGVFVAILGHSPAAVAEAIALQTRTLNFAYSGDFTTDAQERLAQRLVSIAPPGIERVWLTTSGSMANEVAVKLARQYHLLKGNTQKTKIISRRHSYHGSTIGAMSMTGSLPRRKPYEPYLLNFPQVSPPYCYRCPDKLEPVDCAIACANEIESAILAAGEEYVSAFIVEPIAGAPLGGLTSPPEYLRRARDICDRYNVLMIVDEIVSGVGRTGDWFAIEESGVIPDIITLAKGLGGGFVPIGAVLAHKKIHHAFEEADASFIHSESFTGHVLLGAAGNAVLDFIDNNALLPAVRELAKYLEISLAPLANSPLVGEVRGRGLLKGIELVASKRTKKPFARSLRVAERVARATAARGVLVLTGNAGVDGVNGDTVMVAPPYVTTRSEIDFMAEVLSIALDEVAGELAAQGVEAPSATAND